MFVDDLVVRALARASTSSVLRPGTVDAVIGMLTVVGSDDDNGIDVRLVCGRGSAGASKLDCCESRRLLLGGSIGVNVVGALGYPLGILVTVAFVGRVTTTLELPWAPRFGSTLAIVRTTCDELLWRELADDAASEEVGCNEAPATEECKGIMECESTTGFDATSDCFRTSGTGVGAGCATGCWEDRSSPKVSAPSSTRLIKYLTMISSIVLHTRGHRDSGYIHGFRIQGL